MTPVSFRVVTSVVLLVTATVIGGGFGWNTTDARLSDSEPVDVGIEVSDAPASHSNDSTGDSQSKNAGTNVSESERGSPASPSHRDSHRNLTSSTSNNSSKAQPNADGLRENVSSADSNSTPSATNGSTPQANSTPQNRTGTTEPQNASDSVNADNSSGKADSVSEMKNGTQPKSNSTQQSEMRDGKNQSSARPNTSPAQNESSTQSNQTNKSTRLDGTLKQGREPDVKSPLSPEFTSNKVRPEFRFRLPTAGATNGAADQQALPLIASGTA